MTSTNTSEVSSGDSRTLGTGGNSLEHPGLQITTVKLDGKNYLEWSRAARMFIGGRGKLGYITGKSQAPAEADPSYEKWETDNLTVMSWLINSMEPHIRRGFLFLNTAKEIWDSASQTYSQQKNIARVYQLKQKISNLRQGEMSLADYYASIRAMWEELDYYQVFVPSNTADSLEYGKLVEENRIFEFLRVSRFKKPINIAIYRDKNRFPS
ncbi:hypothetical protein ACHQM5_002683 [Ranunculus cassubicifolius]